jgi:hypothetical protein
MGILSNNLDAGNVFTINNLIDPVNPQDAVTKIYVDNANGAASEFKAFRASENINSHVPVAVFGTVGEIVKLDATNILHLDNFVGFTTTSVTAGSNVVVQVSGVLSLPGWNLTVGTYLAGVSGSFSINDNINNVFKKIIGKAISANDLLILHYNPIKK